MPVTEHLKDVRIQEGYKHAQDALVKRGIYHMVSASNGNHLDYSFDVPEGKATVMSVSPKALWSLDQNEQQSLAAVHSYFKFMTKIPEVVNETPGLLEWLKSKTSKLELDSYDPNQKYHPFLLRPDLILDESGKFTVVDPNVVPMGLAEVIALKQEYGLGFCNVEGFVGSLHQRLNSFGLDPQNASLGIVTLDGVGSYKQHHFMANLLNEQGLKTTVITPDNSSSEIQKVDAVWNFVRPLKELGEPLYSAWKSGELPMINPPGIKAMETQVWFALLRLPHMRDQIAKLLPNTSIDEILSVIPETYIAEVDSDGSLNVAADWHENGMIYGGKELLFPTGFNPGERHRAYIKSLETAGSKGVMFSSVKGIAEKLIQEPFYGFGLIQRPVKSVNSNGCESKFELYTTYDPIKDQFKDIATAVLMARGITNGKVHGGTGTIESIVDKEHANGK